MRRDASMSRATFSSSETVKGSSWTIVDHSATAGSTSASSIGWRGRRDAARAISTARAATRSTSAGSSSRAEAAKPRYPFDEDPHAEALGEGAVDALHLLVAHGERLVLLAHEPGVGVVGPGPPGRLHRLLGDLEHGRPLTARRGVERGASLSQPVTCNTRHGPGRVNRCNRPIG